MFGLPKTQRPALIVAGLGNPEKKYLYTRHNAGFLFLSALAQRIGCEIRKRQFDALTGFWPEHDVLLMMPMTYMNLSGVALHAALRKYRTAPENVVVVHDDMDIPVGRAKFHFNRSSAGHKGIESIIEKLGTREFYRIRIGIGKPGDAGDTVDYVLSEFDAQELKTLEGLFEKVIDGLLLFIGGRPDAREKAMESVNRLKVG